MNLHPTTRDELPEIGAAHILALDIYCGVQAAWFGHDHRVASARWVHLTAAEKADYIDQARKVLLTRRPSAFDPLLAPIVASGLGPTRSDKVIGQIQPKESL